MKNNQKMVKEKVEKVKVKVVILLKILKISLKVMNHLEIYIK
jgi:flagellar motor switch protein FliM